MDSTTPEFHEYVRSLRMNHVAAWISFHEDDQHWHTSTFARARCGLYYLRTEYDGDQPGVGTLIRDARIHGRFSPRPVRMGQYFDASMMHGAVDLLRHWCADRQQHRYAMTLHTDQARPHVHVVVKAVSEHGERLNIRRVTLRKWRRDFAQYLREYGVEANATERAVRGSHHQNRKDGIFRAARRGESRFMRERIESVARELAGGGLRAEHGKAQLVHTRREVERGWLVLAGMLQRDGMRDLAEDVRRHLERMPTLRTDREEIAHRLHARIRDNPARSL